LWATSKETITSGLGAAVAQEEVGHGQGSGAGLTDPNGYMKAGRGGEKLGEKSPTIIITMLNTMYGRHRLETVQVGV